MVTGYFNRILTKLNPLQPEWESKVNSRREGLNVLPFHPTNSRFAPAQAAKRKKKKSLHPPGTERSPRWKGSCQGQGFATVPTLNPRFPPIYPILKEAFGQGEASAEPPISRGTD